MLCRVNYLAHLLLSPTDTESMVGNLMADFRRHVDISLLPPRALAGMQNHQNIDKYTDNHPVIQSLREQFEKPYRRFSGIIVDVVFDYYLSKHWARYNNISRTEFIKRAYRVLGDAEELLPEPMQQALHRMITQDWLGAYATMDGIATTITRIGKRIRFDNPLHTAIQEIQRLDDELESGFLEFFPQLLETFRPATHGK